MDNYQNIYQNNESSIDDSEIINNIQLHIKPDDFNSYKVTNNDGFYYTLIIHTCTIFD
jgi:hypothetical protein